jgi:hypothetical protein
MADRHPALFICLKSARALSGRQLIQLNLRQLFLRVPQHFARNILDRHRRDHRHSANQIIQSQIGGPAEI